MEIVSRQIHAEQCGLVRFAMARCGSQPGLDPSRQGRSKKHEEFVRRSTLIPAGVYFSSVRTPVHEAILSVHAQNSLATPR